MGRHNLHHYIYSNILLMLGEILTIYIQHGQILTISIKGNRKR
jgi:hypothetical protein